jgi:hypothetical protein
MFSKLISNLAISPTAIDQIAFYSQRLRQEQAIRRSGLILIVISMFIQVFAAMVPPEQSLAASNNDVIAGGVSSLPELKSKYDSRADVRALYTRFGINSSDITNAGVDNTTFNFQEQGSRGTRTVGRINFASTKDHNLGQFAGSTFYSRSAGEWSGSTPAYYFGQHKGTDGHTYHVWVLKDCGNIAYRRAGTTTEDTIKNETPIPVFPVATPTPAPTPPAPQPTHVEVAPGSVQPEVSVVAIPDAPIPAPAKPETPAPPTPTKPAEVPKPISTPDKKVCENDALLPADSPLCKCVDNDKITANNEKCAAPTPSKEVRNITQKLDPAATLATKAKAGDVLEYTLTTKNTNVIEKKNYTVRDYIGDLLDYSSVDTASLMAQNGTYDPTTKSVLWSNQTLPAKGELKRTFKVTVKKVIPGTNSPSASATDFDCKMQNGYGNETMVGVDCPILKQVETLPNTGPGTTVAIAFGVTVLSGYFFMRSRLLAKEVKIIKQTYQSGY